ncbi:MAG: glycosyltransferase family 2 protein [Verrucomicrobia subdivision 3 bacterium]|nr:glycosyltransferase family 2 protein [Limisphaerales bacterium]
MRDDITPLILTFNEAPNIRRTLERLQWAQEIVVLDSFSDDETIDIVRTFPNARFIQRAFNDHTSQWNHGLQHCSGQWVLSLDADYVLSEELTRELKSFDPQTAKCAAYYARFRYCIYGRALRGSLYPPRAVLFRKACCRFVPDGHTQKLSIDGAIGWLRGSIDHDDRKPLSRWFWAQDRYAALEAKHLLETPLHQLDARDRIRRYIFVAPALVFFYTLLGKGLILDGWPGWYYVFQRTVAETILSLRLMEEKWKSS